MIWGYHYFWISTHMQNFRLWSFKPFKRRLLAPSGPSNSSIGVQCLRSPKGIPIRFDEHDVVCNHIPQMEYVCLDLSVWSVFSWYKIEVLGHLCNHDHPVVVSCCNLFLRSSAGDWTIIKPWLMVTTCTFTIFTSIVVYTYSPIVQYIG